MSNPVPAIVESAHAEVEAAVRKYYSALREAEAQLEKAEKRYEAAKGAVTMRRRELGLALIKARAAWPERGPKAKGWGEFLTREGLTQSTAWRLMEEADPKFSCSVHEIYPDAPHAAERPEQEPGEGPIAPSPGKPLHKVLDMQLLLGTWQDMLADIGAVDTLITDPPYSERVHASTPTRDDGSDAEGLSPNYEPWSASDVEAFVEHWAARTRGWMLCLCDDELIPAYRAAYERVDRVAFAPVPCVINGMSVRTRGDGPSSWAVYAMVARPRSAEFAKWGTLPGAYVGPKEAGAKHGRGKPRWLTDAFVRDYTRQNDLVCDPLAGYGGTLISALLMNRRAIGAESDETAVNTAFERANATQETAA